jgi:dolichol-phosphate mannosyltransferase
MEQTGQLYSRSRWLTFNLVGILGAGLQLLVLQLAVSTVGLPYLAATILAVEAALLHNFFWHERWTWRERMSEGTRARRLAAFHAANGGVSLVCNVILMQLLVGMLGLPVVPANLMSILACSFVNYVLSDRLVFRPGC